MKYPDLYGSVMFSYSPCHGIEVGFTFKEKKRIPGIAQNVQICAEKSSFPNLYNGMEVGSFYERKILAMNCMKVQICTEKPCFPMYREGCCTEVACRPI